MMDPGAMMALSSRCEPEGEDLVAPPASPAFLSASRCPSTRM